MYEKLPKRERSLLSGPPRHLAEVSGMGGSQ